MQTITAYIELLPDFDAPLKGFDPNQVALLKSYETLSYQLIEHIHTMKNSTHRHVNLNQNLQARLIMRELYRYVPISKACFPFEDDPSDPRPLIRTTITGNIPLQIRLQLAKLISNPLGYVLMILVHKHINTCVLVHHQSTSRPCLGISSAILTALPSHKSLNQKGLNLKGYFYHLGKWILTLRSSGQLRFHSPEHKDHFTLFDNDVTPDSITSFLDTIEEIRPPISSFPPTSSDQEDDPLYKDHSPRSLTPTNVTPSPPLFPSPQPILPPGPAPDPNLFVQAHQRSQIFKSRHITNFSFWSTDLQAFVLSAELKTDFRQAIEDILSMTMTSFDFRIPVRDPPIRSNLPTMFFATLISEHFSFLQNKVHSDFKVSNLDKNLPTVLDCVNTFSAISLASENILLDNYDSPMLKEVQTLLPLTFSIFSPPLLDKSRAFGSRMRQALLWTIPPYCTSFAYYSFLQTAIYIHSYSYPSGYFNDFSHINLGSTEEMSMDYPFLNIHFLRIWHYLLTFETPDPEEIEFPEFLISLASTLQDASSAHSAKLRDKFFCTHVNGCIYSRSRISFSSVYDNPLVHPSCLDPHDRRFLERTHHKFLPTYSDSRDTDGNTSDSDQEEILDLDEQYYDSIDIYEF
jgi:hypothetical protein